MIALHGFQLNVTPFFMQTVCVAVAAVTLMDATKKMISVSRHLAVQRSLKLQILNIHVQMIVKWDPNVRFPVWTAIQKSTILNWLAANQQLVRCEISGQCGHQNNHTANVFINVHQKIRRAP